MTRPLGTVEQALDALKAGLPVLVVDSPDRENEGDVILSAATTSVEWVAWTIRHSSGYMCAPMPIELADKLDLPLMVPHSEDPRRTAYTVTVDAASGITTGISAADRHRTLEVLADPNSTPASIIRPGHVLPLRAMPGGVLHRAGHTEAAVDLVRLSGTGKVAAIAELVNDDGTMMRLPHIQALAEAHDLVVLTIADLIEWRRANDPVKEGLVQDAPTLNRVEFTGVANLPTEYGLFNIHGFRDLKTGAEHIALLPQQLPDEPARLVRVHSECLTGDALGSLRCDCGPQLHTAMRQVAEHGGAVIYLGGHEGRGIGLLPKIQAYTLQDGGRNTIDANTDLGYPVDRRDYTAAAAILQHLGLDHITLLTNNDAKVAGLRSSGIHVGEVQQLQVGVNAYNHDYLMTKQRDMGHNLTGLEQNGDKP